MANNMKARVATEVSGELVKRRITVAEFARLAGIDPATAGDFLAGRRWPRSPTLGKIEAALGWEPGFIAKVLAGEAGIDDPREGMRDAEEVLFHVPSETFEGLSDIEREEVLSDARLRVLQRAREIRNQQ